MLGFLGFSVLLVVVLWLFQTVFLETFYKSIKTDQVKSCAYSVADHIDDDELRSLIGDIEEQNNMSVTIYNTDSNLFSIIYETGNAQGRYNEISMSTAYDYYHNAQENSGEYATVKDFIDKKRFNRDEEGADFFNGDFAATTDQAKRDENNGNDFAINENKQDRFRKPSLEREDMELLAFAKIVTAESGEYLVIVESEISPVNSVVETLRVQLLIVTGVILLLSVAIAIVLARMIAKPISDANENAKALANQKYDSTFSGGRYKEIEELNSTLNFAADQLGKVDSLQKELIANISHDLRTPLTMIIGYSEIMRDLPGEITPENLQIIIDEASRLNNLVTDLLDISRLQSGTADLKIAPFSLTNCIKSIFSRYIKLIEADGLNLVFEHEGEVFINGDELRMTQVLYNLINNAVNYIGEDKTVIVRQTVENGMVRIDVIDHGEGIPQEKLDDIWDRYYRVEKEHKRAKIGTGLGLSIVKNILLAHDADFGVASKVGEGSDFYFSLPIIDTEEETE